MKNTVWLILVICLLGGLIWYLKKEDNSPVPNKPDAPKATYDVSASKFAVKNIEDVGKIFIANKQGDYVTLKNQKDGWIVNDTYVADPNTMELILNTIQKMSMQYIPPASTNETIIKNIAVHGIAVELFDKSDNQMKKYYVGGMTQDERGTYFLMDKSKQPYVLEVPGFMGNIRERFKPELERWRSQKFLNFDVDDVTQIQGNYPLQAESSFDISLGDKGFNTQKINSYLVSLNKIACESYLNNSPIIDSISATIPFFELKITRGETLEPIALSFWTRDKNESATEIGSRYFVTKDEEFMLAQFQVIKPAFRDGRFFEN